MSPPLNLPDSWGMLGVAVGFGGGSGMIQETLLMAGIGILEYGPPYQCLDLTLMATHSSSTSDAPTRLTALTDVLHGGRPLARTME
jgi:hypothetical protein